MIHVKFVFDNGEVSTGEFDDYEDFTSYMSEYIADMRKIKTMEVADEGSDNN